MKKLIPLLLLAVIFISCGKAEETDPFCGDFEARVCYSRLGCEFELLYSKEGERERLEIVSPAHLSGAAAEREGESLTLGIGDLAFPSAADGIFTPLELFGCGVLRLVSEGDGKKVYENDSGITLCTDADGAPLRLVGDVENERFEIEILEFNHKE